MFRDKENSVFGDRPFGPIGEFMDRLSNGSVEVSIKVTAADDPELINMLRERGGKLIQESQGKSHWSLDLTGSEASTLFALAFSRFYSPKR